MCKMSVEQSHSQVWLLVTIMRDMVMPECCLTSLCWQHVMR